MDNYKCTFYKNIPTAVSQSGHLSNFFNISRRCRQGDPLSPYIFLLCVEILSLLIKNIINIKGITIGNIEYNMSQFVDDTSIILDGSEKSLSEALSVLNLFAQISGLQINKSKTRAIWIGSKKFSRDTFNNRFDLDWSQGNFTVLGIIFSCDLDTLVELNYNKKIDHIEKEIKQWSKRILTPFGKITIVKTLLTSKLNHLFISLPNPSIATIKKINHMLYQFVWNSKTDKVKRDIIIQDYFKGGLKMINVEMFINALKTTWIRRLITKDTAFRKLFETFCTDIHSLSTRRR